MATFFLAVVRLVCFLVGCALLALFVYNNPLVALQGLGANGAGLGAIIVALTRLVAIALSGPALMLLGIFPRMWRISAIPLLWAIVSTIIVYPREFDILF